MASKDIRPGDVWIETDGDYVFIIDEYENPAYYTSNEPLYLVVAYYNATDPRLGFEEESSGTVRWPRDLATLVYRQDEEPKVQPNRAELVSYQMFRDALAAPDMTHSSMIDEYLWDHEKDAPVSEAEIAEVRGRNLAMQKALIRYLDDHWKPSDS